MSAPWRLIPRFHPQVSAWDIWRAWRGAAPVPEATLAPKLFGQTARQFALSSASAALAVVLRSMSLKQGAAVAVPAYTCGTVFEAVRQAGLQCAFVDIDPETFAFDLESLRQYRGKVAAVAMVHTFGFVSDLGAVQEASGGLPVIEDCAHAMGSLDPQGRPVGLRGAASVFSFNFHKPVSAGGGGILLVHDPSLVPAVERQMGALPACPPRPAFKVTVCTMLKATLYRAPWYGLAMRLGQQKRRDRDVSPEVVVGAMSPTDRALVSLGLQRMASRMPRHRGWAAELCRLAGDRPLASRFDRCGPAWNGYLWPVLEATPEQRDRSLLFFRRRGVEAFVLYRACLQLAEPYGYRKGMCPRLEEALPRLLMLPCYAELTASQRRRIARAVKEWRSANGTPGIGNTPEWTR